MKSILDYIKVFKNIETYKGPGPRNMAQEPRIGLFGGGFLKLLYKGKPGLQLSRVQKDLIKKYKDQGMPFIDALTKGNKEGFEIVNQRKLKIIKDKMSEVNIQSDDYVNLMDEHIRIVEPDFYKDIKRWDSTRPDLADKQRALFFPDWAEARYGADYEGVLQRQQARALRENIDPNFKEPLSSADQMVSDIDDMNKANLDELLEGRKKNAYGGRIGYDDGQLVQNTADGSRPGYRGVGQPRKFDLEAVEKAINSANSQFKYTSLDNLAKGLDGVGDGSHLKGIIKRQNLPTLDSYAIKAEKAFIELFKDSSRNADEVIKPLHKIAEMIGIYEGKERVRVENISNALKKSKVLNYAEDVKPLINKLSSANFIEKIKGKDWNITDVEHSIYNKTMLRAPKTDAEHLMTYVIRHQDQAGGDAVFNIFDGKSGKRITDMSQVDSYHDIFFKDSKGKMYDMDYMTRKGRTDPMFKEYFDIQDQLVDMKNKKYWPDGSKIIDHTGKHVTFGNYSGSMYKHGYGYKKPYERFPYETDHLNLKKHPFKNLTILPQRINVALGAADRLKKPDIKYKIGGEHFRNLSIDDLMTQEKALGEKILIFDEKGNHIGKKLKTPYTAAKIKVKGSGVQLSSLGGVFDEALKSPLAKKAYGLARTLGVEFEAAFIGVDFINNLSKGIEPGEALQKSLQAASFNFYKGGDRKTIENIKKVAEELGFDPKVMDSLIKVNQSQLKIIDFEKKINNNLQAMEDLKEKDVNNPLIKSQIKSFENMNRTMQANLDKEIEIGGNLFNTYKTNVKRSKGSFTFTDEDINKSFIELQTAGFGLLKKKQIKSAKRKSTQADLEAGAIGDVLQNALGGLWTIPKFAYDVINPFSPLPKMDAWKTEGTKERERIIDMQKKGGPGELYRYNKYQRGFDIDQPVTGQAFQTMKKEQPYLGFAGAGGGRAGYMGGGITGIRKPNAIAPTGGPMHQGLRSLYINDKDY